jgi:hypothetical protein
MVVSAARIIRISDDNQQLRANLAEVNHVKYNLLNVEEWAEQLKQILDKKIQEFQITSKNKEDLELGIQNILYQLLDEMEVLMEKRTEGQFSRIKRWAAELAVDIDQLRDSVPAYSVQILSELEKPETKNAIRNLLTDKLDQYAAGTNSDINKQEQEKLLEKYEGDTREEVTGSINLLLSNNMDIINRYIFLMVIGVLTLFLMSFFQKAAPDYAQIIILVIASLVLLVAGVSLPMIQLEAKIDLVEFDLLGEQMRFKDNILYFQSKSISEMVRLLIQDGSLRMIFVGSLIFMFSLIFPLLKLSSTVIYQAGNERVNRNSLIRFFVHKSGKWSMADVMVVAIFMAYIGFNGIVDSQMEKFAEGAKPVEVFTTNGTQLLSGFYLFLAFVLSGLALSELVKRIDNQK